MDKSHFAPGKPLHIRRLALRGLIKIKKFIWLFLQALYIPKGYETLLLFNLSL